MPYLDRIWNVKALSWRARERLLEMHQEGIFYEGELTVVTLHALNTSRLGEHEALQLLGQFAEQVKAVKPQLDAAKWKNALLLLLLSTRVMLDWAHSGRVQRLQTCSAGLM